MGPCPGHAKTFVMGSNRGRKAVASVIALWVTPFHLGHGSNGDLRRKIQSNREIGYRLVSTRLDTRPSHGVRSSTYPIAVPTLFVVTTMPAIPDLSMRTLEAEIMDHPDLDETQHTAALRGLERINRASGVAQTIWRPIFELARSQPATPLRLLDIATGAGDLPIALRVRANRHGLELEANGCDKSPHATRYANRRAAQAGVAASFFELNVLAQPIPDGFDVIVASLFFHHLRFDQMTEVLEDMARAARRMVIVCDLRRCRSGLVAAHIGTRLLSRCGVVHTDGPRSVRAACSVGEFESLVQRSGLKHAIVKRCWPMRMMIVWRRS